MRSRLSLRLAIVTALIWLTVLPSGVSAYAGQVAANVMITGPTGTIACGLANGFKATVITTTGVPFTQESVFWTISAAPLGAADTINPAVTPTDANGAAFTTVTFGGSAGPRTLRATSGTAFGQIVITPTGCAAPPPLPLTIGTCASALGFTESGPFSPSTKVQSLGGYITFQLSFGPAYANKPVLVTRALRGIPFAGWGSFFGGTIRIANANGDVYYKFRSRTPAWISVRGFIAPSAGVPAAISRACQGRWRA